MTFDQNIIAASSNQISTDLDGESVILHLDSGVYYSLNEVGANIWSLIQQPKSYQEIRAILMAKYQVTVTECDRDIQELLKDLAAKGLVEIRAESQQ